MNGVKSETVVNSYKATPLIRQDARCTR